MKYDASQAIWGMRLLVVAKILWAMQKMATTPAIRKQSINNR